MRQRQDECEEVETNIAELKSTAYTVCVLVSMFSVG